MQPEQFARLYLQRIYTRWREDIKHALETDGLANDRAAVVPELRAIADV